MDEVEAAFRRAFAAAAAELAPVWGLVRDGAAREVEVGGSWMRISLHPVMPRETLAGIVPAGPGPALFDDTPRPGEDPPATATDPPRGVRPSYWNVFLAVSELRRGGGDRGRVCVRHVLARLAEWSGTEESRHTTNQALRELMRRGYLVRISPTEGYDFGPQAPRDLCLPTQGTNPAVPSLVVGRIVGAEGGTNPRGASDDHAEEAAGPEGIEERDLVGGPDAGE